MTTLKLNWLGGGLGLLLVASGVCLPVAFAQEEGGSVEGVTGENAEIEVEEVEAEVGLSGPSSDQQVEIDLDGFQPDSAAEAEREFPSLLDTTRAASVLIPPLDVAVETERALRSAGRVDPFVSLIERDTEPLPLPPLPGDSLSVPEPEVDPAAFARSVEVTGIMQIGTDLFALLQSGGSVPEVVPTGGIYQSARVASISVNSGEVVLEEGGERIVKMVPDPL